MVFSHMPQNGSGPIIESTALILASIYASSPSLLPWCVGESVYHFMVCCFIGWTSSSNVHSLFLLISTVKILLNLYYVIMPCLGCAIRSILQSMNSISVLSSIQPLPEPSTDNLSVVIMWWSWRTRYSRVSSNRTFMAAVEQVFYQCRPIFVTFYADFACFLVLLGKPTQLPHN